MSERDASPTERDRTEEGTATDDDERMPAPGGLRAMV